MYLKISPSLDLPSCKLLVFQLSGERVRDSGSFRRTVIDWNLEP